MNSMAVAKESYESSTASACLARLLSTDQLTRSNPKLLDVLCNFIYCHCLQVVWCLCREP